MDEHKYQTTQIILMDNLTESAPTENCCNKSMYNLLIFKARVGEIQYWLIFSEV